MAGLTGAKTTIGADGKTVTVTADSEATARDIAADLETKVRKAEGGPGAKFNNWLSNSLNRFDETLGLYGDRMLNIIRDSLLICAMALAIFAWWRILPGYEPLMATIGALIVFGMKTAAGRLDKAEREGDQNLRGWLAVLIVGGLILEVLASSSLQAFTAVQAETGRKDVDAEIRRLNGETQTLQITLARVPEGSSDAIAQRIDGYLATPMVNRQGTQLVKTVRTLLDETECKGDSYYVGIYCPTLLEMQGEYADAVAYEKAKARYDAIGPMITHLQSQRPTGSSTFALASKATGGDGAWWVSLLIPVGLTVVLNLSMLLYSYLAGRAKRTPAEPATSTEGTV